MRIIWTCPTCGHMCGDEPEYQKHIEQEHPDQIQHKREHLIFKKAIYPRRLEQ